MGGVQRGSRGLAVEVLVEAVWRAFHIVNCKRVCNSSTMLQHGQFSISTMEKFIPLSTSNEVVRALSDTTVLWYH
jgi:hypothetical protein